MGTWGTGIFASDTAADVRDAWRAEIIDGLSAEEATARVLGTWGDELDDPDESVVFWLALAAAQSETGRLQAGVRDRALAIIEAGGDVARWEEEDSASGARQREKVLERLAAKLRGPQPKPKRLRSPRSFGVPIDVGDIVLVRNKENGTSALFAAVAMSVGRGRDPWPDVEPLLWRGPDVPSPDELARMPALAEEALLPRRWERMTNAERAAAWPLRTKLFVAATTRKDEVFSPHIGEVVARGIARDPYGHYESDKAEGVVLYLVVSWAEIAEWVGSENHRRAMDLTEAARPT
ncbi:MAG: hypothetical protein ACRDNB_08800 [Gaiellaceae bacterium]